MCTFFITLHMKPFIILSQDHEKEFILINSCNQFA